MHAALPDQSARSLGTGCASRFVNIEATAVLEPLGYFGGQNEQAPLYGLLNGFSRLSSRSFWLGPLGPGRQFAPGGDGSGWTDVLVRLTMSKQHPVELEPEGEDHNHEN